ncbi:MAG: threonylcarbamoyl-AMP synthase [Oligoflexia bacterium]|nr:threonylcarbamoyl-AMP synthase [Oligoflexia bacterium]
MFLAVFHEGNDPRNEKEFADTVRYLKNDAVVVYPTDTGYSIGCSLHSEKATERITQIQLRPADKPYTVMCSDLEMVREYAEVDEFAEFFLKQHLPGPYTFILRATEQVPKIAGIQRLNVGIRIPESETTVELIRALKSPFLSSTVRMPGGPMDPLSIARWYHGKVDGIVDGGTVVPRITSVIDLSEQTIKVIREGAGPVNFFRSM